MRVVARLSSLITNINPMIDAVRTHTHTHTQTHKHTPAGLGCLGASEQPTARVDA